MGKTPKSVRRMLEKRNMRRPLEGCRLTEEEWNRCWNILNTAQQHGKEQRNAARKQVRKEIRDIYKSRCGRRGGCLVCGEDCGWSGLCPVCWRAVTNNGLLRAEGHTRRKREGGKTFVGSESAEDRLRFYAK